MRRDQWGRWMGRGLTGLVVVGLLAGAVFAVYGRKTLAQTQGELRLEGLRYPVQVRRDASDVAHVMARDPRDAWMALGYVHAQERPWQMEFNRRVMRGRLSEVLGKATIETDQTLLTLGIRRTALRQLESAPADVRVALESYSRGVNAFFADSQQALSPEFKLLGVNPRAQARDGKYWDAADSAGWMLLMALDLGKNWSQELVRMRALQVLDTPSALQVLPPYADEAPVAKADLSALYRQLGVFRHEANSSSGADASKTSLAPNESLVQTLAGYSLDELIASDTKGSNNWVVDGTRTESGKPLLANDPHLGLTAPAIWYFARLQAPAVDGLKAIDVTGATLPGTPFVVLGRTRGAAWGYTNTGPDTQDLYIEQIDPNDPMRYRVPDAPDGSQRWEPFEVVQESIPVKGQDPVTIEVRRTRHGPVISDIAGATHELINNDRYALALRWSALDDDNTTLRAIKSVNEAQTVDEQMEAFSHFHSPMQNVVMADTQGRIAFRAAGRLPIRSADNDIMGLAPAPGWDARYDWSGWVPFAENPGDDGSKGWISTANNRIHPKDYPYFVSQDWRPIYRKQRIDELLAAEPKHSVDSFQRIQSDQKSLGAMTLLPYLQRAAQASSHRLAPEVRKVLAGFDGEMKVNGIAPLVISVWAESLTRDILGSRLGEEQFKSMYVNRLYSEALEGILTRDDKGWCGAQGCAQRAQAAFDAALDRIAGWQGGVVQRWTWGRSHPAISTHRPFSAVAALRSTFEVQVPTGGDSHTINVAEYHPNKDVMPFANRHAASLRAIYDLANLDNSRFIYQTGQSGSVFSPRYGDMKREWADVKYRYLQLDPSRYVSTLTLQP